MCTYLFHIHINQTICKKGFDVNLLNNKMEHCSPKLRICLVCFSCFDIVFSAAIIVMLGLYIATCKVEEETVINQNTTLEQLEYFYEALEECGYKEEGSIPSPYTFCPILEIQVIPVAGLAVALNYLIAVVIQIMVWDKHFLNVNNYSTNALLLCIPIGTLLSMSLACIAVSEYSRPQLCWLAFSITEQRKSITNIIATKIIPVMLAVYKPLQLAIFYVYGCNLFRQVKIPDKL